MDPHMISGDTPPRGKKGIKKTHAKEKQKTETIKNYYFYLLFIDIRGL